MGSYCVASHGQKNRHAETQWKGRQLRSERGDLCAIYQRGDRKWGAMRILVARASCHTPTGVEKNMIVVKDSAAHHFGPSGQRVPTFGKLLQPRFAAAATS